jgi:signal transduction histidine kinase
VIPGDATPDPDRPLALEAVHAVTHAVDAVAGMERVVALLRRECHAGRVEWWADAGGRGEELLAADGFGSGIRHEHALDGNGFIVMIGGGHGPTLRPVLAALAPVLRLRRVEEQLADAAAKLARRNAALEDFAALVAHELKTPLHAARLAADPSGSLEQALDLVDELLRVARADSAASTLASAAECLRAVLTELHLQGIDVTCQLAASLQFPAGPLRVILRNLLRNAAAAGARTIHVSAEEEPGSWRLTVDDDGVGLTNPAGYCSGNGIGLDLCRRLAGRFGGMLDLAPGPTGGTRATLQLAEAA